MSLTNYEEWVIDKRATDHMTFDNNKIESPEACALKIHSVLKTM